MDNNNVPYLNLEYFFYAIYRFFVDFDITGLKPYLFSAWSVLQVLGFIFSILFIIGIIYTVEKIKAIRSAESAEHDAKVEPAFDETNQADPAMAERWNKVLKLSDSPSQSDWLVAIVEADIILDAMLDKMGYQGISIGDKLKRVEPSDFLTLNQAWEAHKVRNLIAHEGSSFVINQREAKRVINLYKEVFEEFYYI